MAKATKLKSYVPTKVSLEVLSPIEISAKCPYCSFILAFYFETTSGFIGEDKCDGCGRALKFKGVVESVTRCSVTISPIEEVYGGGKLDTFESKDLLSSSEDAEDEDLEATRAG